MKSRTWLIGWLMLVSIALGVFGGWVYQVDPFFHYHKPDSDVHFYPLNNQRSQNDGICRHFEYDALITGTSMTENFKTSELNEIFGVNSIKVPYSGGTYKEINDNLTNALAENSNLKIVVRGLDMGMFFDHVSRMREDLGTYPTYLYDDNPFNDVNYLFNREVMFNRVYPMTIANDAENFEPGITSFDDYSCWQSDYSFGKNTVCPNDIDYTGLADPVNLVDEEKEIIRDNITQNVTLLADKYPDVDFYYFFTPYSIVWWEYLVTNGTIYKQIQAEQYIIELILEHENIHLYSFNNRTDITTDLNNYKDAHHYAQWINSLILRWMYDGECLLTKDNYQEYICEELEFYTSFDYDSLNEQEDYESDYYAAALLNEELTGTTPINLLNLNEADLNLIGASLIEDAESGSIELQCVGSLNREDESEQPLESYLINCGYLGAKIEIEKIDDYRYLTFYGRKVTEQGQPTVYIYNEQNEIITGLAADYSNIDNQMHQYLIDLTKIDGKITIILNGGYIDSLGSADSKYIFKDVMLY